MATTLDDVRLTLIESGDEYDSFRRWLGQSRDLLAVDIETTGLSLAKDRIRTVQFGDTMQGWVLPWEDWRGGSWSGAVRETLRDYDGPLGLQHAKFDAGFLQREGVKWPWHRTHDTMPMSFLRNSLGPKGLKPASAFYLNEPAARAGEAELKKAMQRNRWTYETVPIDFPIYWGYGAMDTVLTARLADVQWPAIQEFREAYDLEMACQRVLCDMELRGVRIDVPYCEEQAEILRQDLAINESKLAAIAGSDFNPNSDDQVIDALQREGAKLTKKTDKGNLSVDKEVLGGIDSNVARLILEHRTIEKLLGSFFQNFLDFRSGDRLHPHINQLQARTGRMSVTEPALQTVPRKKLVRDAFIPDEDEQMVMIDYDNEELRVAAHFSHDEAMLAAFAEGRDLHAETATILYGADFTKPQRGYAKNSMFAMAYGAGVEKVAMAAGVSWAEAKEIMRVIATVYPGIPRAMADVTAAVRGRAAGGEFGWVQIVDGRHLRVRADKAYVGFNALIQGSCAVVLKQSIVDLDSAGFGGFIRFPIHDELAMSIPKADVKEALPEIVRCMTRTEWSVPLTVSPKLVDRWGDNYE